ncbi:MAG: sensor histidine kinase [Planctomycetota bacterium]|nr:MAG: sensor histidine kinase [Planctomycetota bacterium]
MARRSLKFPITLGVVMIVLVVVLAVGWVVVNVFSAVRNEGEAGLYWSLLAVGSTLLALILVGVIVYLVLSIKAINLNRRQSNFIDSVTHELKSPIASLKLYLQTLSRHQVSPEEQADFCRFMLDDVARLERLINHVLDAARLEHGDVARATGNVDLVEILTECADVVCQRYRIPRNTVRIDAAPLDARPAAIRADRHDLELVFRNLLDNAVKYAGDPPEISVEVRRVEKGRTSKPRAGDSGDRVLISVTDNGHGIPRALHRKIFGRFVRLGLELERKKPGTGLGLYIVRTIVRQLRGDVRVRERSGAAGTIFEVELPEADVSTDLESGSTRQATAMSASASTPASEPPHPVETARL